MARIVEAILTEVVRGAGTKEDPCRTVAQLWSKRGFLMAEHDPWDANLSVVKGFGAIDE